MMASPEFSSLFYILGNSLSAQEQLRQDAEAQLEKASANNGFGVMLLQIAASANIQADVTLRQAAAIYFKNLVSKRYDPYDEDKVKPLSDQDKTEIRRLIVPAIIECVPTVRPQLIAASHKMIRTDFPRQWPGLVDELYPFITSGQNDKVINSLSVFIEVVSWNGSSSKEVKELIHGRMFPILLEILLSKIDSAASLDRDSLLIVKSILKTFHAAINYRFSEYLLLGDPFSKWCNAITHVIKLVPPQEILNLSHEDAESHLYWKAKKWAVRIHNKIFGRYGCAKLESFNNPDHPSFAKFYMEQVAIPILNVYLEQIQNHINGQNPMNDRIFCLICDFLENSLRHKKTWEVLEKHYLDLLSHFIFPRLCFSKEDQELWDDDPEEFVRSKLDPFEEIYSIQTSSINFVLDLVKCRKKVTFVPVLQFINSNLSNQVTDLQSLRKKDGALFLLGSMASILMDSDFKAQVESVITSYVIPELSSQYGFLRLRAAWTIEQYDELEYKPETCLSALQGVLTCLTDKDLPVKVAAAGALGALLDNATTQASLPPHLPKVMETVLALANEIQMDTVAFLLEKLVQIFSDNLTPFAVQLCVQLRDTVVRHLEGYKNVLDADEDDENFGENTDKMMAAVGMISTIDTLVDSMKHTPELLVSMEEVILPLLAMIFDRRLIDVFEEAFELVESLTFNKKNISSGMWNLFPYIYRAFIDAGVDYIQDMWATLDNFISYDPATLLANENNVRSVLEIIKVIMTDDSFDGRDRIYGCRLMESMMLHCRGRIDGLIPAFIEYVVRSLSDPEFDGTTSVVVHHLEAIINAIYYNPALALSILEGLQATESMFTLWFKKADKFTRVHDKRLVIMAISQLMSIPYSQLPLFVRQNWKFILPVYLNAIESLPKALEERQRLQEEGEKDSDSSDYEDFTDEGDYDEINDQDDDQIDSLHPSSSPSRLANTSDAEDFEVDNDDDEFIFEDELEEELFYETPLDKLDIAGIVQQTLRTAVHDQSSFQVMAGGLNEEQMKFLQSLVQNP